MRFVSQQVNDCLGNEVPVQANFGLTFNKWLTYRSGNDKYEPEVAQDRSRLVAAAAKAKTAAAKILKQHHIRQAEYCQAMEKAGWKTCIVHARLTAPFVSGLGAAHPTETGLVLDHTSGMPYIPAAGQKGVLRIAHLINSLKNGDDWLSKELLLERGIIDAKMNWLEDDASKTLFGSGGNNDALAGQLTILDAYPVTPPDLGEDILNPHFKDYYEGKRGPTEDQSPVPIKFLVVKPGAEFVFRVLLRHPFAIHAGDQQQEKLVGIIKKNIQRAVTEVGMGAKTALGFGRFSLIAEEEPGLINSWITEKKEEEQPWLSFIRKVDTVEDWGQFKQTVLDAAIDADWQVKAEVAAAVNAAAIKAQKQNPKKWDKEREQLVADWLQVSGVKWQPAAKRKQATPPAQKDNSALLEQINSLAGWAEYKEAGIKITKLDKECTTALKEKFVNWKLKKSKDSQQKKEFKSLVKRLKVVC